MENASRSSFEDPRLSDDNSPRSGRLNAAVHLMPNADKARRHTVSSKRLFDPTADTPSSRGPSKEKVGCVEVEDNRAVAVPRTAQDQIRQTLIVDCNSNLEFEHDPELLMHPETRPISYEQLVVEVKVIYANLVMVEAKCIDVDDKQALAAQKRDPTKRTKVIPERWSALIALHKTSLHEHHDFFLASQHPAASSALSKLAAKHSMPARMWRHGIHSFLRVLRHRQPVSLDYMLAFIYIAYCTMALLYETMEAFRDTWIDCLKDLGPYREEIEGDDVEGNELWCGLADHWRRLAECRLSKVNPLHQRWR